MSTTYVGFYRPTADSPVNASIRETGALPAGFGKMVNEFPAKLPATCKLIGSWIVSAGPSVIVVEAESLAALIHISGYYGGWLEFDWRPTRSVPRDN